MNGSLWLVIAAALDCFLKSGDRAEQKMMAFAQPIILNAHKELITILYHAKVWPLFWCPLLDIKNYAWARAPSRVSSAECYSNIISSVWHRCPIQSVWGTALTSAAIPQTISCWPCLLHTTEVVLQGLYQLLTYAVATIPSPFSSQPAILHITVPQIWAFVQRPSCIVHVPCSLQNVCHLSTLRFSTNVIINEEGKSNVACRTL